MTEKNILIIEDNEMNMELVKDLLETNNYHVLWSSTAGDAIELLKKIIPDLIVTDIQLPDLDGCSLIELLKNNKKTGKIPIIALTASAMAGDKERILKAGCDEYISKPINTKIFIETVKKLLVRQ